MRTACALLSISLLALPSCAEVTLRQAMQEVQRKYFSLAKTLEGGLEAPKNFEARERAEELRQALASESIRAGHSLAEKPEFQQLLAEALGTVERLRIEADQFDAYALWEVRESISYRCQGCHDRFRN